jgi:hypothetical protein
MMTAQHKMVAAVIVAAAFAFAPAGSAAGPVVLNANFSLGYSGFTSSNGYLAYPGVENPGLMYPEGMFTVGSNPGFVHDRWTDFGDHTTGGGLMMIVNGNRAADMVVWSTTVDVDAGTLYDFSAWAASTYWRSPSGLAFSINGQLLDAPLFLPSERGEWQQFAAPWYSGDTSTAVLALINLNTEWNGNDFALDDIMLNALAPPELFSLGTLDFPEEDGPTAEAVVPEPASLLLFGSGLAALAGVCRKGKK